MSSELLLLVYCVLILLVSLAGGLIPLIVRLTHQRMQIAISLVAGVMLGVGLLHMLPHALLEAPDHAEVIFACVLAGFLTMFFIERFLCFHHHDVAAPGDEEGHHAHHHGSEPHQTKAAVAGSPGPGVGIRHEQHRLNWVGASIGLTLHTIIAGIALAASIEAQSRGAQLTAMAGFGTFLVIFLHKPFDAMTITTLMTVGGWKRSSTHVVNGLFALMVPVGVLLFYQGLSHAHDGTNLIAYALAFSAGTFLCVSMSDLLPELQFHTHDRIALSFSLLVGLSIAGGVGLLETHSHADHGHALAAADHQSEREPGHNHAGEHQSHRHEMAQTHGDHAEEGHDHAPSAMSESHPEEAHVMPAEDSTSDAPIKALGTDEHGHADHSGHSG